MQLSEMSQFYFGRQTLFERFDFTSVVQVGPFGSRSMESVTNGTRPVPDNKTEWLIADGVSGYCVVLHFPPPAISIMRLRLPLKMPSRVSKMVSIIAR